MKPMQLPIGILYSAFFLLYMAKTIFTNKNGQSVFQNVTYFLLDALRATQFLVKRSYFGIYSAMPDR